MIHASSSLYARSTVAKRKLDAIERSVHASESPETKKVHKGMLEVLDLVERNVDATLASKDRELAQAKHKVIDQNRDLGEKENELAEREEELAEAKQDVADIKENMEHLKENIRDAMTPVMKDGKLDISICSKEATILKLAKIREPDGGRLLDDILPTEMAEKFDDEDKVNEVRKKAEAGDTDAMFTMSWWIRVEKHGLTSKDYAEGFAWAKKGSDAGNFSCTAKIGNYYRVGCGVERNLGKALHYLMKAHQGGSAYAARCLAHMYEDGELGLKKDPEIAFEFHSAVATNEIRDLVISSVEESAKYVAEHKKASDDKESASGNDSGDESAAGNEKYTQVARRAFAL